MPPESLKKILVQQGATNLPLPILKEPVSPFSEWLDKLIDWVMSFFPKSLPGLGLDPASILKAFAIAVVVVGLFALVYYVAERKYRRASVPTAEGVPQELPVETLELKMREAVEQGDYSLAARFRWRLFLLRRGFPQSRTPREVFPHSQEWLPHYRLMFCPAGEGPEAFERFRRWTEVEERRGTPA